jgi:AhpD family alkylhydroperoxidase
VNLYWYGVLRLMAQQGRTFELDWTFRSAPFTECQVCISGHKGGAETNGSPS